MVPPYADAHDAARRMPPTDTEATMVEIQYSSFLVRCWSTPDGEARLVVEHVQSGERVAVPNVAAALVLLATWAVAPPARSAPGSARGAFPVPPPPLPHGEHEEVIVSEERSARR
jgi:hypothetical protein